MPDTAGQWGTDQTFPFLRLFQSNRGDKYELNNTTLCVNI